MAMEFFDMGDVSDSLARLKEVQGVDLTPEQFQEFARDWTQLLAGPISAVVAADTDAFSTSPWNFNSATGEVTQQLTPEQEQVRERLQRIAKETHQTLLNRYRA
jgi:hypothetical protein